jgi:ubiquinone/menaquinone biosynthesis C-methylase UbiE
MKDLKDLYDRKYAEEDWSKITLNPDAISTTRYDDTARLLRGEKGKLLELGCGSGGLSMALANQFDEVVACDLSEVRIELGKRMLTEHYPELKTKVRLLAIDGEKPLPFIGGEFDAVILCAVIEHVVDVFGIMDEAARVCKKGACVVITVPNISYIKNIRDLLLGRLPLTGINSREIEEWRKHGWDGSHLHYYFTKSSLNELLLHVGFQPEAWTGNGKWAKLRRWRTNWVGDLVVRARRL